MASGEASTTRLRDLLQAEAGHSVRRAFSRPVVATSNEHNAAVEAVETLAGEAELVWDEAAQQSGQQGSASGSNSSTWPAVLEAKLGHLSDLTTHLCSSEKALHRARNICGKERTHLCALQQQQQQQQGSKKALTAGPDGTCSVCGRQHAHDRQGDELATIYAEDLEYVAREHASLHQESETEALRLLLVAERSKLQEQLMESEQSAEARRVERQAELATMRRSLIEAGCKVSDKDFDEKMYGSKRETKNARTAKLKLNLAQLQHRTSSLKAVSRQPGGCQSARQRTTAVELDTGRTLRKTGARVACPRCLMLEPPRQVVEHKLSQEENASSAALSHWLQTAGDKVISAKRYSSAPVTKRRFPQDPKSLLVLDSSHHIVPETKDQGGWRYWVVSNYTE